MSNYYVTIRHPHRIGVELQVVPTGKTRTTDEGRKEAEGRVAKEKNVVEAEVIVLTPKSGINKLWITKQDLVGGP